MQPFLSPLRLQCFRFLTPLPSLNHSLLLCLPMAQNMLMRLDLGSRCGAIRTLGILCVVLLVQKSEAREFLIGGKGNWGTPTDNTTLNYNQWAEKNRFQIGDSIGKLMLVSQVTIQLFGNRTFLMLLVLLQCSTMHQGKTQCFK